MLNNEKFDKIAEETAEETIKDIYRACDWALDGHKVKDFNEIHGKLMKLVASKVANKLIHGQKYMSDGGNAAQTNMEVFGTEIYNLKVYKDHTISHRSGMDLRRN